MREHDAALCLSDHAAAPAPWEVTASFVYIRGHGAERALPRQLQRTRRCARGPATSRRGEAKAATVYCYFDNDVKSAAPADAQRLLDMLQPAPIVKRRSRLCLPARGCVEGQVVAVDHLGAAGIAEDRLDLAARRGR